MTQENRTRPLAFDGTFVKAHMVYDARDYKTTGVVTNLSAKPIYVAGNPIGVIPAWRSVILKDAVIISAERASVVYVPDDINLGGIALRREHALAEKCAFECDAIKPAYELIAVPDFNRMTGAEFE